MPFTAPTTAVLSGPRSEWRRDVTSAPAHAQSAHVVEHLVAQTQMGATALNCYQYGLAMYEVGPDQPVVNVNWPGRTVENQLYAGLLGVDAATLKTLRPPFTYATIPDSVGPFRNVPLPDGARPAVGSDGSLSVYQPSTRRLWEFWQARQDPTTGAWSASWGGYVPDLATHNGRYETQNLGVSASGLVAASGQVTIREVQAGVIDHALSLGVPQIVGKVWSYPATRCDGSGTSTAPTALHEGQRFRLPMSLNIDALALHPIAKMIARAAQRYGFIVTDRAGVVIISAEEGTAMMAGGGLNPWPKLLTGAANWQVLKNFPWDKLEALPFDWGKAA